MLGTALIVQDFRLPEDIVPTLKARPDPWLVHPQVRGIRDRVVDILRGIDLVLDSLEPVKFALRHRQIPSEGCEAQYLENPDSCEAGATAQPLRNSVTSVSALAYAPMWCIAPRLKRCHPFPSPISSGSRWSGCCHHRKGTCVTTSLKCR